MPEELELIRKMIQFNDVLEESVRELEPHRMVFYLLEFAGEFHRYYNRNRVVSDDIDLSRARLLLVGKYSKDDSPGVGDSRCRCADENGRKGGNRSLTSPLRARG